MNDSRTTAAQPVGQQWNLEMSEAGYFHLKSANGFCLEGNGGVAKGGSAFMDACRNTSRQLWKLEAVK